MSSSSSKSHSRKSGSSRNEKSRVHSESGGSSQCDTPPLIDKEPTTSQGKYSGVSPESINCISEQIGIEINNDVATNLAEDVSYKLRQLISNIAIQSSMMNKSCVDKFDVNTSLMLSDTSPIVGATGSQYSSFGDEKLCTQNDFLVNVTDTALTPQSYSYSNPPTLIVEWITDEKSLNTKSNISVQLQNYYTKVARAILNLKKKPKDLAVRDLTTNTRIGPIFPNLFNLAVLVLNDDNLKALNVPAKKPLQSNVLDMVDALCSNPCSLDTNIQQQFQRLFPVMVSNILGNGSLSEKMVFILTKITRTWPAFVLLGKEILFDYLSQGTKERLTAPMIKCVTALGREALVECLSNYLDYIDDMIHAERNMQLVGLLETILDASTCLLRSELTTFLEDYVTTDYTLYEILGDAIMPRRTLFVTCDRQEEIKEKVHDEEMLYTSMRTYRYTRLKLLPFHRQTNIHRESVFIPTNIRPKNIQFRVKCFKSVQPKSDRSIRLVNQHHNISLRCNNSIIVAKGLLNRFQYKMNKTKSFPIFGSYVL